MAILNCDCLKFTYLVRGETESQTQTVEPAGVYLDNSYFIITVNGIPRYIWVDENAGMWFISNELGVTTSAALLAVFTSPTCPDKENWEVTNYFSTIYSESGSCECLCTRFRWDKPVCCLGLYTEGTLTVSLPTICAESTENHKVSFVFTSGSNSFKIAWSSVNQRWEFIWINSNNLVLAYLDSNIPCPFGDWTITNNHRFITSMVTSISTKKGIGIDCENKAVVIDVPFDINAQGTAGNWTENICLKDWSINNQGVLILEHETSGLCSETQDGFACRSWYKLIDCKNENNTLCVFNDLSEEFLKNSIIQIATFPEVCWRIEESEECTNIKYLATITATFTDCESCLPDQPSVGEACNITMRPGEPGFSVKYCDPDEYIKIKCIFADSVYALFKRLRYGIETCCEYDLDKSDIKNMLLDLGELYDPDMCVDQELPIVCCSAPTDAVVGIYLPLLIGCPAPTNVTTSIQLIQ